MKDILKNPNHPSNHIEAIEAIEKTLNLKEKKRSPSIDIKLLNQRLDSHSRRINKLQDKLAQIISNQKHYLKLRLPDVLRKEKTRVAFSAELDHARKLLRSLDKQRFTFLSNSKDEEKRKNRYIGMFTHVEMGRLRRLLDIDHSFDYILYRKDNYKNLKDKHVLLLDEGEKRKLKYILRKRTP